MPKLHATRQIIFLIIYIYIVTHIFLCQRIPLKGRKKKKSSPTLPAIAGNLSTVLNRKGFIEAPLQIEAGVRVIINAIPYGRQDSKLIGEYTQASLGNGVRSLPDSPWILNSSTIVSSAGEVHVHKQFYVSVVVCKNVLMHL